MEKVKLDNQPFIYPMPVVIVGAEVEGKPNYMTAAWVTPVNFKPVMIQDIPQKFIAGIGVASH